MIIIFVRDMNNDNAKVYFAYICKKKSTGWLQADQLVGELMSVLERRGERDTTNIIITFESTESIITITLSGVVTCRISIDCIVQITTTICNLKRYFFGGF